MVEHLVECMWGPGFIPRSSKKEKKEKEKEKWATKMAPWVGVLANPEDLCPIPGNNMVEGENQLL